MTTYDVDTSALVKRYIDETGSKVDNPNSHP
jgi:hypothetical protein